MNCVKRKFRTEIDAELALEYIRNVKKRYRREKHPIRYYHCEYCGSYHLTSQPANIEEIELIHILRFKELLEKQRIEEEIELEKQRIEEEINKMFTIHNKPEKKGSYKRQAWKIIHMKKAAE